MRTVPVEAARPVKCAALLLAAVALLSVSCTRKIISRDDAGAHENKGDQFYEKGDLDSALKEYTRAMELGSQKLKVYNNIGDVYFRQQQFEVAEKYYRMALNIDPSYLFSRNNLALTLFRRQDLAGAKTILEDALKGSPNSALLRNSLGQILVREGDLAGGVAEMKKAIELNPDYAVALNNLGDVYLKNPELGEDPLPYIMRAIEKDPDNELLYDNLGWYYCRAGVFDEALLALGRAFIQEPDNAEIRMHYATALEWLGKTKEALEQWKAVMEMPADREMANLALRHYWEIKGR